MLLMGDGDYGFLSLNQLPKGEFTEKTIPLNPSQLAVTGDFRNIAHNHCGAVCALNIIIVLFQNAPEFLEEKSPAQLFKEVHRIIGNGPTPSIAGGLAKYAKSLGANIRYQSEIKSFEGIKAAIGRGSPCGILLANALADWHWVMCVGYREYQKEGGFIRICDGWNRTADRFYKLNSGSAWAAGTEYFLER